MNDTEFDHYYYLDFTILAEEVWIVVSAIINVLANVLLTYCLIRLGVRSTTYIAIFNLAVLDVIQLISCPAMYKVFSITNELMEEFEAHSVFTNIFFCAKYGIVLCYLLIIIKMHWQLFEKAFLYILPGMWIILTATFIGGYVGYQRYYRKGIFMEIYIILFIALFITMLIDQMISTVNLGKEKSAECRIAMVLILLFLSIRICLPIFFIILFLVMPVSISKIALHILIGLALYNSIGNILILFHMDMNFKNVLYHTFKMKTIIPTSNVNFVNLPEEIVNILEDE